MTIPLKEALSETLDGWIDDVSPAWRPVLRDVELGFDQVDPALEIESWEPIFPTRRNRRLLGEPEGAHILRAFDGPAPDEVKCVILGQDPYPCPAFSTGRAFEAGNVAHWRELDKMFSKSVRAFIQTIVAARTGRAHYARDFDVWPELLEEIENGDIPLESPGALADRWAASGVLLLNSSLTISRFSVDIHPHQSRGHMPLWKPLLDAVLSYLVARGTPVVFICMGAVAEHAVARLSDAMAAQAGTTHSILRPHPAFADAYLEARNPFIYCNTILRRMQGTAVDW